MPRGLIKPAHQFVSTARLHCVIPLGSVYQSHGLRQNPCPCVRRCFGWEQPLEKAIVFAGRAYRQTGDD